MADSGSAGSAGSAGTAGDAGDPICDTLRQALADKRTSLAVCNPGFAQCQVSYTDECGCTVNSSDPFAYQYEERVEQFEQAGCTASCPGCIHEGWNWKCLSDAEGDEGTCQPEP